MIKLKILYRFEEYKCNSKSYLSKDNNSLLFPFFLSVLILQCPSSLLSITWQFPLHFSCRVNTTHSTFAEPKVLVANFRCQCCNLFIFVTSTVLSSRHFPSTQHFLTAAMFDLFATLCRDKCVCLCLSFKTTQGLIPNTGDI